MTAANPKFQQVADIINDVKTIVIIQADNPDGDSLASSLALEHILGDLGKTVNLYCGVDIPSYLSYLSGWDRVSKELPKHFDASIIVDTSSETLLGQLQRTNQLMWLKNKPCVVLDHHLGEQQISFATISLDEPAVSTGELIYEIALSQSWKMNHEASTMITTSIMADSRGLTSDKTTARSIHIIADLVDAGVSIPEMETARRAMMSKSVALTHYKGQLLQRLEYVNDNEIAIVTIPWKEIETYSHAYNPTMLIMEDMLLTQGVKVAIGFKQYTDGKVTAKIRCNYGSGIANKLAEHFGGGGHPYASGFKVQDGRPFNEIKSECIRITTELLHKQQD
jgi:phosphoesterase RecJ-like protein